MSASLFACSDEITVAAEIGAIPSRHHLFSEVS
jgi:hypothetical protein